MIILFLNSYVLRFSSRYLDKLGRHNYVTPTSYLELISSLKALLGKKQEEVCMAFVYPPLTEHNIDLVVNNSLSNS